MDTSMEALNGGAKIPKHTYMNFFDIRRLLKTIFMFGPQIPPRANGMPRLYLFPSVSDVLDHENEHLSHYRISLSDVLITVGININDVSCERLEPVAMLSQQFTGSRFIPEGRKD